MSKKELTIQASGGECATTTTPTGRLRYVQNNPFEPPTLQQEWMVQDLSYGGSAPADSFEWRDIEIVRVQPPKAKKEHSTYTIERGFLVKIDGARPEYMSGTNLIKKLREAAERAQRAENALLEIDNLISGVGASPGSDPYSAIRTLAVDTIRAAGRENEI